MGKAPALYLFAAAIALATSSGARATWPRQLFAPYVYVGGHVHFNLARCEEACGQKFFILAFIIANPRGLPAWDGRWAMHTNLYARQIAAVRRRGGNVIASFGGAGGKELARTNVNSSGLAGEYQAIINRYHFNWLDFDVEGAALANGAANNKRNAVLAQLQKRDPGIRISFTVPADPDGLDSDARKLISNAAAAGVAVYCVNVMTSDFGSQFIKGKSTGTSMARLAIATAAAVHRQCRALDPQIRIGVTPMINHNDNRAETFTRKDARLLVNWAKTKRWVCMLSFWSVNRDARKISKRQNPATRRRSRQFPFTRIFQRFSSRGGRSG